MIYTLVKTLIFVNLLLASFLIVPVYAAELSWDNGVWGDSFAPDFDGDGYEDVIDAFYTDPTEWTDLDSDGIGNNSDWDIDGDGVVDIIDSDPLDGSNTAELNLPLDKSYKGSQFSTEIN